MTKEIIKIKDNEVEKKNNIHYLINMSKSWLFLENENHTTQTSSYFDQEEKGDGTNE